VKHLEDERYSVHAEPYRIPYVAAACLPGLPDRSDLGPLGIRSCVLAQDMLYFPQAGQRGS
jgi:hypothetical protein